MTLTDGTRLGLRPIIPEDKQRLVDGFDRLSPESRFHRFFTKVDRLSDRLVAYLTEIDYVDHFAWAAFDASSDLGIGVARYVRSSDDPQAAEAAVAVADDYQGRGIGTLLLRALAAVAFDNGVRRFRGYVMTENLAAQQMLRGLGATMSVDSPGVLLMEVDLPLMLEDIKGTRLYEVLKAAAAGAG